MESGSVSEPSDRLEALAALASAEGGWGYAPGQGAHLEPTCHALLALSAEAPRFQAVLDAGKAWLARCAFGDGTYRLERGRPEAVWPTALVLFVQASLEYPADEIRRTAAALLGRRGRQAVDGGGDEVNDIDLKLVGWPWAENTFSWVEPTAWACLALRRAGQCEHPRVREGEKLLLDRALEQGGVNYGNRRIFGVSLEAIPGPTALMLLALQGRQADPRVAAAVEFLRRQADAGEDLEHLCWARLALDAYADHPGVADSLPRLEARIRAMYAARAETPWLRPAPLREALTALALNAGRVNPFRLAAEQSLQPPLNPAPTPTPRPPSLGERIRAGIEGLLVHAETALRPLDLQTRVHIASAGDYDADLADVLRRQYEDFRERVPLKGKRVVLKPNLVEYHRDKVINTHPHVIAAAIELCRREGAAEVLVAEGPGHWRNVEHLVAASGLGDVLRHYKVPFIDLNHDEPVKTVNLGRLTRLEHLYLSQTIATADVVISMPKLKTHHWAVATLSLKNLFGTLPGLCYGWPKNELHWRGIDNSIVDIACTRKPDLAIVDGIVGMEGDGPLNGAPKPMRLLVMGCDPVAVDATCCRLMQLKPEMVPYLVLGNRKRLGLLAEKQIQQVGETIAERAQPFDTVPHFKPVWTGRCEPAAAVP
jgi:uncharacterized protein (DUF362 family)